MANCIQCGRKLPGFTLGKKICQWCKLHEAAQRGEISEDAPQPVIAAPWVRRESSVSLTHILFGANVAIYVAMAVAMVMNGGSPLDDPSFPISVHFGANYGPLTLSGEWWRLVSYMFLHGGPLHIAMNMWALWNLGTLCESLYGRWTYAAIYLITGVAGGVASLGWNPRVWSVGASGALFGLTGALIASFYLGEFSLSGISIKGTLSSLLFFAGFNLFFGSVVPGIDNACHIGGLLSGLLLGALIAVFVPQQENVSGRVGVLLLVTAIVAGSTVGVLRWRGPQVPQRAAILAFKNAQSTVADLQKKIRANPQDAASHYALAHAYLSLGQKQDAADELKRVVELQPQHSQALLQLGAIYLNQGQAADAQAMFAKLTATEPNNVSGHAGLGMALADQGNHAAAIDEFKAALKLDPQLTGIHYNLGLSQAKLQRYDDAISSYQKEVDIGGDDPDLENSLADAYQAKGMTKEAQAARDLAIKLRNAETE